MNKSIQFVSFRWNSSSSQQSNETGEGPPAADSGSARPKGRYKEAPGIIATADSVKAYNM